jgi:hypothetical protein
MAFTTRLFKDGTQSLLIFSSLYANLKENLCHLPRRGGRCESEGLSEAQRGRFGEKSSALERRSRSLSACRDVVARQRHENGTPRRRNALTGPAPFASVHRAIPFGGSDSRHLRL